MSSANRLPNRRRFLERSALGAGGVLLLPGLLASCTDHYIPPTTPVIPLPPLVVGDDVEYDWNDEAKTFVTGALGLIPEVGEFLSFFVELLWPGTDIWSQIKDKVEALIDQKISDDVYRQVKEDLGSLTPIPSGLVGSITLYMEAVKGGDPKNIIRQWGDTRTSFVTALSHFQSKGYELLLLPLFAQFANMYLGLLRDGVIYGESWGMLDADQQTLVTDLKKSISAFTSYVVKQYDDGHVTMTNLGEERYKEFGSLPLNPNIADPFRTINAYELEMTISVLDYMNTWAYYDVTLYPNGKKVEFTRELYDYPAGFCYNSGPIVLPKQTPPTQAPEQIIIAGYSGIDGVWVTYPGNTGPDGSHVTQWTGNPSKHSSKQPPNGGVFNLLPNNPIVKVMSYCLVSPDSYIWSMQFTYYNGTSTTLTGVVADTIKQPTPGITFISGQAGHYISSIHITGLSVPHDDEGYTGAECAVFGLKYWQSPATVSRVLRTSYITSPKERSAADLAKVFTTYGITQAHITDELKTARQSYWAKIKARAEALK